MISKKNNSVKIEVDYEEICKTALRFSMKIDELRLKQVENGNTIQRLKSENKSIGQDKAELERQRHSLFIEMGKRY
jgi:hypothetical protein